MDENNLEQSLNDLEVKRVVDDHKWVQSTKNNISTHWTEVINKISIKKELQNELAVLFNNTNSSKCIESWDTLLEKTAIKHPQSFPYRLTAKALSSLFPFFGIQSLLGPAGLVFNKETVQGIAAQSKTLKTTIYAQAWKDLKSVHNMDVDEELLTVIGLEIGIEINKHILANIMKSAAKVNITSFDDINDDTVPGTTWMIVPPELGKTLEVHPEFIHENGFYGNFVHKKLGCFRGREVWTDALGPATSIIMGYKHTNEDASNIFCPYIIAEPFCVLTPETFVPFWKIKSRYATIANPGNYHVTYTMREDKKLFIEAQ